MKLFHYTSREIKNLFEFYFIPLLVVILPHRIYYPIFKFICSKTFFYKVYSQDSYKYAKKIIIFNQAEKIWDRNVKLLHLIDISDSWLCMLRPKKALKLMLKKGNWQSGKGFLALSAHWGTGFNTLLDLKASGYNPFFVFVDAPVSFKNQSVLEKYYRRIRRYYVNKISGSVAIPTGGGGYNAIQQELKKHGAPVILFDAPRENTKYSLNLFGYKFNISSGFIHLICNKSTPFQLFSVKLNFETGYKELTIDDTIQDITEDVLIEQLSNYLENLLTACPENWYFWRHSFSMLKKTDNTNKYNIHVLAYHSANVIGNEYYNNDHIAFKQDLELIKTSNIQIISAKKLVGWLAGKYRLDEKNNYVVLTFDDGNEMDFTDWQHPEFGMQKSFYTEMKNSKQDTHATAFVIASPNARNTLEETCLDGHKLLGDSWWQKAESSGLLSIENHSWDHVHPSLENVIQKDNIKGDFSQISTHEDVVQQIEQSTNYINKLLNKKVSLFAYPFGHYNSYLVNDYFPHQQTQIKAAFTCEPNPVTKSSNIFKIPRYVCGHDWKSIDELKKIILGKLE